MNNLRDLVGYFFGAIDEIVFHHQSYRYCCFVASLFSEKETFVSRHLEPLFPYFLEEEDD